MIALVLSLWKCILPLSLSTSLLNPTLSFFAQIGPTFYFITSIRYAFLGLMYLFSFNISCLIQKEGTKDLKDS